MCMAAARLWIYRRILGKVVMRCQSDCDVLIGFMLGLDCSLHVRGRTIGSTGGVLGTE